MSAALFIVLEKEIPGIDSSSVGGKFLSRHLDLLDEHCRALHVRPLSEFISISQEEAAAFIEGEDEQMEDLSLPSEKWFDADEGLRTIQALLQHAKSGNLVDQQLMEDLSASQEVLSRAKVERVRFHFAVDF